MALPCSVISFEDSFLYLRPEVRNPGDKRSTCGEALNWKQNLKAISLPSALLQSTWKASC